MALNKIDIEFEELNFEEFIDDGIFEISNIDEDIDEDNEDEDEGGDISTIGNVYRQIYNIKREYVHRLFEGMKPFVIHTRFKMTKFVFRNIEKCEGVEFFRPISQYRAVICFGKLFDITKQQNEIRRCVEEIKKIKCQLNKLAT